MTLHVREGNEKLDISYITTSLLAILGGNLVHYLNIHYFLEKYNICQNGPSFSALRYILHFGKTNV